MAKPKFDGVIEAVHYNTDGQVDWVRAYLRRGPAFSDRVKLDRQMLVEHLRSGKRFVTGRRIPLMGGFFEIDQPLRLEPHNGRDVLVVGDQQAEQDFLKNVPLI